jgi:hypothetical protein
MSKEKKYFSKQIIKLKSLRLLNVIFLLFNLKMEVNL